MDGIEDFFSTLTFEEIFLSATITVILSVLMGGLFLKSRRSNIARKQELESREIEVTQKKQAEEARAKKRVDGECLVDDRSLMIGDIEVLDPEAPTKHFLIAATIGAGKSQTLHTMLDRVFWGVDKRPSSEKAIITDPSGEFLASRGSETDLILNPFDKRSLSWSPFNEIVDESDWEMVARAIMPDSPIPSKQEWVGYGRNFLIDIMKSLHAVGNHNIREVSRLITQASQEELCDYLAGTSSELLVAPGGDNLLKSVRFEAVDGIRAWSHLQPTGDFSIRKWINEGKGTIFITYSDSQVDSMIPLIRAWLSLGIRQTLSLEPDFNRRVWFVMDEFDSLGRVDYIKEALSRGRKYGLCAIGVIQSLAQLEAGYGHDIAKVLRSVFVNKLIMTQGSAYDGEEWSREIGEFYKEEVNSSTGHGPGGETSGSTTSIQVRRIVTGTDLMNLQPGVGYALIRTKPGGLKSRLLNGVNFFRCAFHAYPKKIQAFIDKKKV